MFEDQTRQLRQPTSFVRDYRAYGLKIRAELALPELAVFEGDAVEPEISIRLGEVTAPMLPTPGLVYRPIDAHRIVVQWPGVGSILVENGSDLTCAPAAGVSELVFRLFVICQGLAVALQQRGYFVLHASAVEFDGQVIAFAANHGEGKSTLAAACCAAGARMVTDDILAVSLQDPLAPSVYPSFPRMKLRCGENPNQFLEPDHQGEKISGVDKALYSVAANYTTAPSLLRRIYFLGSGPEITISPADSREAFLGLCAHSYGRALIPYLKIEAAHLRQCGHLITAGLVRSISRPRDLTLLPNVLDAIRQDLA